MRTPGGDQGPEREDTEGELEQASAPPEAASAMATSSDSAVALEAADEAAVAEERRKEDDHISAGPPEVVVHAAQPAATRHAQRENEDTRTPSSCSDELQQGSSNEDRGDCGDDTSPGGSKSTPPPKKGLEESPDSCRMVDEGNSRQGAQNSGAGSPPAALIPHLSMPGLRGPRPAPALGVQMAFGQNQQAAALGKHQGPLGDLISWLDDADVGDVLDQFSLTDLLANGNQSIPNSAYSRFLPQNGMLSSVVPERSAPGWSYSPGVNANIAGENGEGNDDGDEDDFEEVPSDKEALPRAPPLAPSAAPLMRPLSPESSPRELQPHQHMSGYCANPGANPVEGHNEEEEWLARQRLTGAIGRLVRYNEAETTPKDDILGLRCTLRGRIMVTAVRENGIAAKAGVVAGDELVSIDGRKEFAGHPAHVVHASLRAPVTLVFLGFVGKLQAEVRVKRPPEPKCGLAPGTDVVVGGLEKQPQPVKLCDAVVFQQGESPSLLITAGTNDSQEHPAPIPQEHTSMAQSNGVDKTIMYELQREDARNLIVNALGTTAAL